MQKRRRLKQAMPLVERLSQHAQQLRKEAKGLPPAVNVRNWSVRLGS